MIQKFHEEEHTNTIKQQTYDTSANIYDKTVNLWRKC